MLGEIVDDYAIKVVDVFAMPQSGTGVKFWIFRFILFAIVFFKKMTKIFFILKGISRSSWSSILIKYDRYALVNRKAWNGSRMVSFSPWVWTMAF